MFALLYFLKLGFIAEAFRFVFTVFAYTFAAAVDVAGVTVLIRAGVFEGQNGLIATLAFVLIVFFVVNKSFAFGCELTKVWYPCLYPFFFYILLCSAAAVTGVGKYLANCYFIFT